MMSAELNIPPWRIGDLYPWQIKQAVAQCRYIEQERAKQEG